MFQKLRFPQNKKVRNVSQILNLKDGGSKLRQIVQSLRASKEECEVQNEEGQTVAVVLPMERYKSYQTYLRQREADFAVLDEIAEDLKDYDPDFIERQIDKAVAEVKAQAKIKQQAD
jgi:hypothetical protein